jgi:hypothetical protein
MNDSEASLVVRHEDSPSDDDTIKIDARFEASQSTDSTFLSMTAKLKHYSPMKRVATHASSPKHCFHGHDFRTI